MSLILFTAVSVATLYMQGVASDAVKDSGAVNSVDAKNLQRLNPTVVGIIVVCVCVMLVNSLCAGASPAQALGTVGVEGPVLTAVGLYFGTVEALAGIVPFTVVHPTRWCPTKASRSGWRRVLRAPAVEAVGPAA